MHKPVTIESLKGAIRNAARYSLGRNWEDLDSREKFVALSLAVREPIIDRMLQTEIDFREQKKKRVYYLSMEYLAGRALANNLLNLGIYQPCVNALLEMGSNIEEIRETEVDPALGNGGLGRLAACFVDSMATLGIPGYGYGINYEFGIFRQIFRDGYQEERPDIWRSPDTPWLLLRSDETRRIPVYGEAGDRNSHRAGEWLNTREILGMPSDMPVVGYGGKTVNYLRLYAAHASDEFDTEIFNHGDYVKAVEEKISTERISKVLYPSDDIPAGRELRLLQEYFFVACALGDIVERHAPNPGDFRQFPNNVAIQLNDTHPSIAVAELMRILVDENGFEWDEAFEITQRTIAYTNHTLLPEAQERWPVELFEKVLPRHLQIIYDINEKFLKTVSKAWPDDETRRSSMSLIDETGERHVRMMNLSVVGSHSVNGVSELHTKLLKSSLLADFNHLWPDRFNNKTNGVTQRRWLLKANPPLAGLLNHIISDRWITDLDALRDLEEHADNPEFLSAIRSIKRLHKTRVADFVLETTGHTINPDSIFDVQTKRIHEYKRQLLNALRIVHDYLLLVEDGKPPIAPRTYLFGGKSAPGYAAAKLIIKLINNMARVINSDPKANDWIKVAFIPDYRVTLAERMIPAADVSEQISTAGMEASGTGNMKFMMNGALTVGTLDGANIEMLEEVGEENIYIFGLRAPEIADLRQKDSYNPAATAAADPSILRVLEAIEGDLFSQEEHGLFRGLIEKLRVEDPFFVLADMRSFLKIQDMVARDYQDVENWSRRSALNIARSGKFSSDRTIRQYAKEIWGVL